MENAKTNMVSHMYCHDDVDADDGDDGDDDDVDGDEDLLKWRTSRPAGSVTWKLNGRFGPQHCLRIR